jgi:3-deoxy-alpha-D-manno-octulosonate 8-oxidase
MNATKSVGRFVFETGAMVRLPALLRDRRRETGAGAFILVDDFFRDRPRLLALPEGGDDVVVHVSADHEPTTTQADALTEEALRAFADAPGGKPGTVVGVGGGCLLDLAKAVSNLLGNGGKAQDYQGWDLLLGPGVYKVGVPTISGTGAESSRTCVMIREETGVKLGMNSDHSVYDLLLLDPSLTATVPRDQYFYTGMDTYIHCVESLAGRKRNAMADAYSRQALALCRETFQAQDMLAPDCREKLMVASYLGGASIAMTLVGLVHPFSAGLSVVLGLHHGLANCVALLALAPYYPEAAAEVARFAALQGVALPTGVTAGLDATGFDRLQAATLVHEKPLANALGPNFKGELTPRRVRELFERM